MSTDLSVRQTTRKSKQRNLLQFGILIPAGMPLPLNVKTSKEVKSGFLNVSLSNVSGHGSSGKNFFALSTKDVNFCDIGRFTTETNPSNSPLVPAGSR